MIAQPRVAVADSQVVLPTEYLMAGEGPPLLLLHGLGDSAHSWQWVMPTLARTHRVYAPSLPGFGASAKPAIDYSPEFFTSFVAAFLDALGLEHVGIVGNSLGGLIAMRLALVAPNRVNALALIDSAGLGRDLTLAMRLLTLPGMDKLVTSFCRTRPGAWLWAMGVSTLIFARPTQVPRTWRDRLYRMARDPGYLKATVATLKSESTLAGQRDREILLDRLPNLTIPTLLIWGVRDRIIPARHAQTAIARLARGQLELLSNCGHAPQVEQPDSLAGVLSQFFNSTVSSSRH